MGPLGGIAAGLRYALDEDYATVLTCGVDSIALPANLPDLLSPAPAYLASQPVVGHWPASAAAAVERILAGEGKHSMLAFAGSIGATAVKIETAPANINTPADLAAMERNDGI
jgi:molybdopterin-guanine dinucleotide biosynthesis protein A